jgi:hypothetical protein
LGGEISFLGNVPGTAFRVQLPQSVLTPPAKDTGPVVGPVVGADTRS